MLTKDKITIRVIKGGFYIRIRVQGTWQSNHPLNRETIVGQHRLKTPQLVRGDPMAMDIQQTC